MWLGASPPWTLAGHAMGGWTLWEPDRAPKLLAPPGMLAMQTPLAFYDSIHVAYGEGAAWNGFGAALATASGTTVRLPKRGDARGIVDLRSGDFGFDENALLIERGDSSRWLRAELVTNRRTFTHGYDVSGRHLWGLSGGLIRGRHAWLASYAQRGTAFALLSGDEQGASGESGALAYRLRAGPLDAGLRLERGYDHHESFNLGQPDFRPFSRREAQQSAAVADASLNTALGDLGARVDVRRSRITRSRSPAFDVGATEAWGAVRLERPIGRAVTRLELGGGRNSWTGKSLAPGISVRFPGARWSGRLGFERLLQPVWADLDAGQEAFLQDTWAGVVELAVTPRTRPRLSATVMAGRTADRALVDRLPFEELWLRFGIRRAPTLYEFGLFLLDARWERGRFATGANGYLLQRDRTFAQPAVDPNFGARTWGAWSFRLFSGDLGVTLRADVDAVGRRETQGELPELTGEPEGVPSRELSPYVTSGARAMLTLAGATLTVRVRNLEDRPREETWFDPATFTDALGPGREWRFALTVRLSN